MLLAMFSPGSTDNSKPVPAASRMPPETITCQGCGQVGTIDTAMNSGGQDAQHRRHGFYLHERGATRVVACRRCQQIQA